MADDATNEVVKMVANVQLRRKSVDSIELPEPSRTEGKLRRKVDIGRRATVAASDFEGIAADQPTVDVRLGSLQVRHSSSFLSSVCPRSRISHKPENG
jgi:hypothetical protein